MSEKKINKKTEGKKPIPHYSSKSRDTASPAGEKLDHPNVTLEKRSFLEKWEHHRFLFFRATYTIFNTVWMIVMAVGGFIAWLIAMIAL